MKKEVVITKKKLKKYFEITKQALHKAAKSVGKKKKEAEVVWDMANRYYKDALYFEKQGKLVTAFGAINYAHGWLDTGSKLGLFKVKDGRLFVVK